MAVVDTFLKKTAIDAMAIISDYGVYQIKAEIFLIIIRISRIYLFPSASYEN
jgi:hypothetical protein